MTTLNPSFDGRDLHEGRSTRTMTTTLNPSFDGRDTQQGRSTRAMTTTLNPATPSSWRQPEEHATAAADRAA